MKVFMFALPAAPLLLAWFMVVSWAAVTGGKKARPVRSPFPRPVFEPCEVCGGEAGEAVDEPAPARATPRS